MGAVGVASRDQVTEADAPRRGTTLASAFDAHSNAVGFLRLAAAVLVIVGHTYALGGFGEEPLAALVGGRETFGGLAVTAFFVLSGFLVTRSVTNAPGTGRFLRRRALRILPGYWVCLIVTAFAFGGLLWWHAHGTLAGFVQQPEGPFRYIERNWLVLIRQWGMGGIEGNPHSIGINGSLWTLVDEVRCYLVLAILASAGVIHRRRSPVLLAMVLFWWVASVKGIYLDTGVWFPIGSHSLALHFLAFSLGAAAFVYADRIPVNRTAAAVASASMAVLLFTDAYFLFGMFPLAYLILYLGTTLPITRINTTTDISYGLYIYAFPVQQALAAFGVHRLGVLPYFGAAAAITGVLALLSWKLVERPMMRLR